MGWSSAGARGGGAGAGNRTLDAIRVSSREGLSRDQSVVSARIMLKGFQ